MKLMLKSDKSVNYGGFKLHMLPAFALLMPPLMLLCGTIFGWQTGRFFYTLFFYTGYLSPILGFITLAAFFFKYLNQKYEMNVIEKRNFRRAAALAILAIISPAWLVVMYLFAIGFNR
jgi:hypothetical protein